MIYCLGVDVGGTFTDLYVSVENKEYLIKSPTTKENIVEGVINALEETGLNPEKISNIVHGSTIATNSVIERNYPLTAFITTKGFRDLIEIGRYHREELYNPYLIKPDPLVMRRYRYEVNERIDSEGNIIAELDEAQAKEIVKEIIQAGIKSVAIGFINSYTNGINEEKMEKIIKEIDPEINVAISSKILPKIRPLGRFNTTIINASLQSIMSDYINKLDSALKKKGFNGNLWFIQSNGGIVRADQAKEHSEMLLLSGPAAGVAAASFVADSIGVPNSVTMDMGGTSCDISLIEGRVPITTTEREILWDMPIPVPMVDITTIGAGGGSIAWVDNQGILKVGPESAGADPGPAFYGKGKGDFTVSDANLLLGYMNEETFIGGKMHVDRNASEKAALDLAKDLNINDLTEVAKGVIKVANNNMSNALNETLLKKGRDPRDFSLVAFGGAGGLHANFLAKELNIPRVIVPLRASVFSGFGATLLDARHEFYETRYCELENLNCKKVEDVFSAMKNQGLDILKKQGFNDIAVKNFVELRYVGQSYELEIDLTGEEVTTENIANKFIEAHKKIYGVAIPDSPIALMTLHLSVIGKMYKPELIELSSSNSEQKFIKEKRLIHLIDKEEPVEATIIDGLKLFGDTHFEGPAVVELPTTTVLIDQDSKVVMDKYGNLIITIGGN